ncbi:hypothetical protein A9404_06155 [Halothiobacillus diazotrophicus]|uniref:Bacterial transcriptional activator domain-containing protein n=1 Tax=Halothiobacillus diazotrophicus TaxID=1860122 RepID=A0A191ZGN5_9GAMM|nr:BTAD domain-containing putative transcriptional regulator [Halothiobacillus diazotrophicus]ANJ67017.1 hypothetical protein A9404_06155 [Halothiobacillus diazotrophicus]
MALQMTFRGMALGLVILGAGLTGCATQPHSENLPDVMALQQHARLAYAEGNLPQAQADYRQLTHLLPEDEDTWFHLGNAYARGNQPALAVEAYRHVLGHDAAYAKAWHNLGIVLMQQAEAAFAESARHAHGDPTLQKASLVMAQRIARLTQPEPNAAPNSVPEAATPPPSPAVPEN